MKRTLAWILCLLTLGLTACSGGGRTESGAAPAQPGVVRDGTATDAGEPSPQEAAAPAGRIDPTDMYAYYQQQIDRIIRMNADGSNRETAVFTLYDLDGDGLPELFLNGGYKTNAYETGITVYSYSPGRGGWETGSIDSAAQAFFDRQPGDGEIGAICVHHGTMAELSYRMENGTLTETVVTDWHERTDEEYENAVNAITPLLVMDQDWTPLEEAASLFGDPAR